MPKVRHIPVLVGPVMDALGPPYPAVMLDGTVGYGGHAEALLSRGGAERAYIGLDRDPVALESARARLAPFGERVVLVQASYADAPDVLRELGFPAVDGLLVDLGVSSAQLDDAERGFGFQQEGPLDMRMGSQGETAAELIESLDADELARILREYGEVPGAGRLAARIIEANRAGTLRTTADLARVVQWAAPAALRRRKVHPATLVFQALRIAVNDELGQLERLLADLPELLAPGGRAVFIAFHSLEDRMIKQRLRALCSAGEGPRGPFEGTAVAKEPELRAITRKAVTATDDEIAANPRARSAKMRAVRRRGPTEE